MPRPAIQCAACSPTLRPQCWALTGGCGGGVSREHTHKWCSFGKGYQLPAQAARSNAMWHQLASVSGAHMTQATLCLQVWQHCLNQPWQGACQLQGKAGGRAPQRVWEEVSGRSERGGRRLSFAS